MNDLAGIKRKQQSQMGKPSAECGFPNLLLLYHLSFKCTLFLFPLSYICLVCFFFFLEVDILLNFFYSVKLIDYTYHFLLID